MEKLTPAAMNAPNLYPEARKLIAALSEEIRATLSHEDEDQLADAFMRTLSSVWYAGAYAAAKLCGEIIEESL